MNSTQIKVFEELLASKDFKGKKQLEHLLWLNTSKPKFAIGDCFKVTDLRRKIYGYPVKDFNAKIVKVYSFRDDNQWRYEMEMEIECGDKKTVSKHYSAESNLLNKCEGNKNLLGDPKSDAVEVTNI